MTGIDWTDPAQVQRALACPHDHWGNRQLTVDVHSGWMRSIDYCLGCGMSRLNRHVKRLPR